MAAGDYLLYWEVDQDTVHFGIRARTGGWVCLGIDPAQAMAEADMVFGWVEAGGAAIRLSGGQTSPRGETGQQRNLYSLLYPVHGVLMASAFVLLLLGMLFPRYFKRKKWWLKTHRRINIAGSSTGVVGAGMAVYMISQTTQAHLRALHSYMGLITIALMIFTPLLGHFMLKIRKIPGRAKKTRAFHRWAGRVTLLFMAATIVLGLFQAGIL